MLRISGRMRIISKMFSKLILSLCAGAALALSFMFMKYKFVYNVKIDGEDTGYVASKVALENQINNYILNGDSDNVGYVILNADVDYEMMLVNKSFPTTESQVLAMVKEDCDVYYKVYAVLVDGNEKALVRNLDEAQKILESVNEKQEKYTEKSTIEIEEKYLMDYDLNEDIEVAINDIVTPIKEVNEAIKEIRTLPSSARTVSDEVLQSLKENLSDLSFNIPVNNPVITSRFGWRSSGYHTGLDLATPTGTPIGAAEDGVVTFAEWFGNYGYLVKVQHSGGYETYYAHCSKILASVGDEVKKGDIIANVGSTGRSSGPHLHLEIRFEGTPLNPEVFIYE